eukprot:sb/3476779/
MAVCTDWVHVDTLVTCDGPGCSTGAWVGISGLEVNKLQLYITIHNPTHNKISCMEKLTGGGGEGRAGGCEDVMNRFVKLRTLAKGAVTMLYAAKGIQYVSNIHICSDSRPELLR